MPVGSRMGPPEKQSCVVISGTRGRTSTRAWARHAVLPLRLRRPVVFSHNEAGLDERARPDVALPDHLREVSASHRLRGAAVTCRNVIGVPSAAAEKVTKCGLDPSSSS